MGAGRFKAMVASCAIGETGSGAIVYRGASLFSWGNLIEIFAPHSQKVVIGFDTFSGFSSDLHIVEDRDNSAKLMEDRKRFLPRSMEEITSVANMLNLSHRFRLISG